MPTEYNDLAVEFGKRLQLATAERPIIVFFDALDQLGPTDPARALSWLPPVLPDHVRVLVSTLPGDCEAALRAKRPEIRFLHLDKMSRVEGEMTLGRWLESAAAGTAGASAQTGPRSIRAQRPASIPQARLRGGPVVALLQRARRPFCAKGFRT